MSMLYCMECKEFVPVWDEHPCPSNYYAAVDKEMTGIVDRLYRMGIKPMIAVCSAIELGDTKDFEYMLTLKIDIGRRISEALLGKLPEGWKYIWETVSADRTPLHMIAYVERWYNMGFETLEERVDELIKEFEEFLDTKDCEAIKAMLLLMED